MSAIEQIANVEIDREAILKSLQLNPRDPNTQALLLVCERYGLDPLLKHMVLIQGKPYVTRDGYLAIAHRSGVFDGMEVQEQFADDTHFVSKVAVYRKDMKHPFTFVGRFPKSKAMAKEYGPEMAVKVAEVQALRRAFNVTGVGASDERWDDAALPVDAETGEVKQLTVHRPAPVVEVLTPDSGAENVGGGGTVDGIAPASEPKGVGPDKPGEADRASNTLGTRAGGQQQRGNAGEAEERGVVNPEPPAFAQSKAAASMVKSLRIEAQSKGISDDDLDALCEEVTGLRSLDELADTKAGPDLFGAIATWGKSA